MENSASESATQAVTLSNPRGETPVREYYEVDRLAGEIKKDVTPRNGSLRVSLQFPDEMLCDAPDVCWEFEQALGDDVLVFCLGDTTYAPCCPDKVAAAHLEADCLVHFGHACLSPCREIPVFYSFGKTELQVNKCVEDVLEQASKDEVDRLIVFYEVQYAHAMDDLQERLSSHMEVVVGRIPEPGEGELQSSSCSRSDCCRNEPTVSGEIETALPIEEGSPVEPVEEGLDTEKFKQFLTVGGIQIPSDIDFSDYALLFVGSDSTRQYLNIILRFLSCSCPKRFYTFQPERSQLSDDLSSVFQRKLNRRFYLVQRAKNCAVFGILVANLSDTYMRSVVTSLRKLLEREGRSSYTFVVGKINPAKLANFAEVDCFILVACPEHSLLEDDREFPTAVITPMELSMALGFLEWGAEQYSLDTRDYLALSVSNAPDKAGNGDGSCKEGDDDADAPYFSLVTGKYESAPTKEAAPTDLSATPGQGQLTAYHSAAADFLKQREYQGLEVKAGATQVHSATQGQQGIASDYGDR